MSASSFKKNTFLLTASSVINKGFQFFAVLFFSRWLTKEEYGQFDLYYSYIMILLPIISLATQEAVFRYTIDEKNVEKRRENITNGLLIPIINFAVAFLVSVILFRNSIFLLTCFLLYLSAEVMTLYLRGYLRGIGRLDIYSYVMVFSTVIMIICVTIFVYIFQYGEEGMLIGYAIGTWSGNIAMIVWGKWFSMLSWTTVSWQKIKELISYSIPLVPNDISWWIMNASDRQIINIFFGDGANGIYAIAHKVPALCSVIFNMFSLSWQQEVISRIDSDDCVTYINNTFNKFIVVLMTVCALLLSSNFLFAFYFFDAKYFEAIQYSPILIMAALIMAISQFLGGIQIALKQSKKNGITTLVGALCNIVVHIVLIKFIGLFAAAISTLIGNIIVVISRQYLLKDFYVIKIKKGTWVSIFIFIYFLIGSYLHYIGWLNYINLVLAFVFFILCNRSVIEKVFHKIIH